MCSNLFCFPGVMYRKKKNGEQLITHCTFVHINLPWRALSCVFLIDWPVVKDRLVVDTSRCSQSLAFLVDRGGQVDWGRTKETKKEFERGEFIDQILCTLNSMFTWPSKLLASSLQCATDVRCFLPTLLNSLSFCLSLVCVYVCVHECVNACVSCR